MAHTSASPNPHILQRLTDSPLFHVILQAQFKAFKAKFRREPGPHDPIFFDSTAPTPTPFDPVKLNRLLIETMARAGIHPMLIHAYTVTGLLASTENWHVLTDIERHDWLTACNAYQHQHDQPLFTLDECLRVANAFPPSGSDTTPNELRAILDIDAWIARLHDTIRQQGAPFALVTYDLAQLPH